MAKVLSDGLGAETSVGVSKVKCRELFDSVNSKGYTPELDSQMYHIKNKILLRSASADVVENTQEAELYGKYCGLYVAKHVTRMGAYCSTLSFEFPVAANLMKNHFTEFEKLAFWKGFDSVLPETYKDMMFEMIMDNLFTVGLPELSVNEIISSCSFRYDNYKKLVASWMGICEMPDIYLSEYEDNLDGCDDSYRNYEQELRFLSMLQRDEFGKELFMYYAVKTKWYNEEIHTMKYDFLWCNGCVKQNFELLYGDDDKTGEYTFERKDTEEGVMYYIKTISGSACGWINESWVLENTDLICNADIHNGELVETRSYVIDVCEDAKQLELYVNKPGRKYTVVVHPNEEFKDIKHPRLMPELVQLINDKKFN